MSMHKNNRQKLILEQINALGKVYSKSLASDLKVSEDTIRRDFNELSKNGLLKKVHGGAESVKQKLYYYNDNVILNNDKKEIIAKKASSLLQDGMVLLISGGTTNLAFARLLPENLQATVYTYCLPIAMELTHYPNIDLFFIGGKIEKRAMVTIGVDVISKISTLKADICFLGTGSIDQDGVSEESYEVSCIKRALINSSEQVVSLVTSDKINVRQSHHICTLSELNGLVTDLDPSDEKLSIFTDSKVTLL